MVLAALWLPSAWGHAFLDHAEPAVGAQLAAPPARIVLHFDSELEQPFSGFRLEDPSGHVIERSGVQSESEDATQLSMPCPALAPGTYRVLWSVVARDGHHTEGDFSFTVR